MSEAKAKHRAQLLIRIEVNELDNNGECSNTISAKELSEFDIKTKAVYTIEGFDKFECIKKLKEILDGLQRRNN
jgi:hypothetical protein